MDIGVSKPIVVIVENIVDTVVVVTIGVGIGNTTVCK